MKKLTAAILGFVAVLPACGGGSNLISGPDILTYVATSQVTSSNPMRFSTTVVVGNTTTDPITFTPACPTPRTLVFSNATGTGTPIWDSNTGAAACTTQPSVTLGVGKTVSYTRTATGTEVLGATGVAGTYYVVDEVTLDGQPIRVSAGQLALTR